MDDRKVDSAGVMTEEQAASIQKWIDECRKRHEADRERSVYPAYGVDDDEMETSRHNHGVSHANA
jgi:hypothetical protein